MPAALQKIAGILPLTQGIKLLKATALGLPIEVEWLPLIVMAALVVICGGIGLEFFRWESKRQDQKDFTNHKASVSCRERS